MMMRYPHLSLSLKYHDYDLHRTRLDLIAANKFQRIFIESVKYCLIVTEQVTIYVQSASCCAN